jgi:hypothetical protein
MTPKREVFVHLLIFTIIIGSAYDIATQQEHWPFSDYPMFSAIHRRTVLEWPRLFGVTSDGGEVALVDHEYLWPLDQSRLPIGLRQIYRSEGDGPRIRAALHDCLVRYEKRRVAGEHEGPPLQGIRLYMVAWDIQPYAQNLDEPKVRELIAEVKLELYSGRVARAQ